MEAKFGTGSGGQLVKECREVQVLRDGIHNEDIQKKLWEETEKTVQVLEKEGAMRRAKEKKDSGTANETKGQDAGADAKAQNANSTSNKPADGSVKQNGSRRSRKAA